jgi:peptidoglycan/xylan/chitin deacetylase (PgdA/CDA1 family)
MRPFLLALPLATLTPLHAAGAGSAQGPGATRIAKFKGDRTAAVSLTFDDGLRNQDEFAVPLLDKYGI